MMVKTLTREEAKEIFDEYLTYGEIPDSVFGKLGVEYLQIRKEILSIESSIKTDDIYLFDLSFGIRLYKLLNDKPFFNDTVAGNIGFWRFLCVCVVPDLIMRRHGLVASYFYEKPGRIYLQAMWWYIHMSFQGNIQETFNALKNLNTDYILQLVERQGRDGFYLEVTREIIKFISKLSTEVVNKKINGANLFRRVLIQNTAKQDNYNLTIEERTSEYVLALFKSCKVEGI